MRDFRKVSTLDLFMNQSFETEIDKKRYDLIVKRRLIQNSLNSENDSSDKNSNELPTKSIKKKIPEMVLDELKKEAEEGGAQEQFNLGSYYITTMNSSVSSIKNAFQCYKNAAENGLKEAQFNLGIFYMYGILMEKPDREKGFFWYKKSSAQGFSRAMLCVALCYELGFGVEIDEKKAFKILKSMENERNNFPVQYCLGIYYENGIGVKIDKKKAFEYYKICANGGYDKGQLRTAICYEYGIGVKQDYKKAFNKYKKAVRNGNIEAKYLMGRCYELGIGTNADPKKAFTIYNELENSLCEDAIYRLAYCYEHSIGTEANHKKAFKIYNELARIGNEDAMFYLTECYEGNREIVADLEEDKANNEIASSCNLKKCYKDVDKQAKGIESINNKEKVANLVCNDLEYKCEKLDKIDLEKNNLSKYDSDKNNTDKIDMRENNKQKIQSGENDYKIKNQKDSDVMQSQKNFYEIKDSGNNQSICEDNRLFSQEDEILFDENLRINIFLEQTIYKQIKDNNLENDLKKLVIKIDKCLNSSNGSLNFNSLGFKKYEGVSNKIYGFDFNNRVNDSDRIIACFVDDYIKKNEFDFNRYSSDVFQHKSGIILFSIAKHNDQEREAQKISKRINGNFYKGDEFKFLHEQRGYHNTNSVVNSNQNNLQDNMTFRAIDINNSDIIYQEVLTKGQSQYINIFIQKSISFILSGIAGSGKTLSTINSIPDMVKKIKNIGSSRKILYVTFSNNLKEYVKEKVMENYYEFSEYIDIKTFEDICTEINYKYNNKKIDRSRIITQNSCNKNFIKFLEELYRTSRESNVLKFIRKYINEKNIIYSEIFGILKGSMYSDWDREEKNIVKEEYYIENKPQIIEDYKIFDKDDRKILYSIAEKYNKWLEENNYYDINDIAFELQSLIKEKDINYEYVVVDEIQDFTEVQIYMLFLLAKKQEIYRKNKTRKILLVGDPNQIINPTFFKIGRLRKLFYINDYEYEDKRLNENFRNSINIMKMNNIVNDIINDKLPARKEEERQYEITKNSKVGVIEQVKATEKNLKIIFSEIDASATVALIVSDDEKKQYLKENYGCENAFTISEVKGKEFDNVIVYNILSDYADVYEGVYKKESLKEGHYSYYFNRFYVSITRANYNLVLIEEMETQILAEIKQKLGDNLKYIENINSLKDLNLGEIIGDSVELFTTGMKFLYDEKYSIAKKYFNLSIEKNSKKLAKLCETFEVDGRYEQKGDSLFEIGEYKLAQAYYEKSYNFSKFAIMYLYLDDLSYEKQLREFYKYIEKEEIDFYKLFDEYAVRFERLQTILKNKVNKTKKINSEIKGKVKNINKLFECINKSFS